MAEADPDDAASTAAGSAATPTHPADANPRGETAEQALQAVVDLHGPAMFYEADALRAELESRCPDARGDIALLLIGLDEQVPQALLAVHADDDVAPLALRLERRLRMRRSLDPEEATWVVGIWGRVLRLWSMAAASEALRPIGRRSDPAPSPDVPVAIAPTDGPMNDPINAPINVPTNVPMHPPPTREATSPPMVAPASPAVATAPTVDPVEPDDAPAHVAPVNRWYGIGGLIAAAAVVVAIVRYESSTSPAPPAASVSAVGQPSTPAPVAATPGPPPEPRITDIVSNEPLVADGRQREVFVSLQSPHGAIDSVEARFVDGDAALRSAPTVVDVSSDPIADGHVPAGLIGARSTKPLKATFVYVVTMADGTRSAPFTKELALAPIAATPPAIAGVVLPDGIVVGKSFDAAIAFKGGDAPIAAVESAVVADDVVGTPRVTPIASSATRDASGTLRVPVVADRSPTTIQFALVDADGVKSETTRVSFDVAPAPRAAVRCHDADCVPVATHVLPVDATTISERKVERVDDGSVRAALPAIAPPPPPTRDRPAADNKTAPPVAAHPARREAKLVPESAPIFDSSQ